MPKAKRPTSFDVARKAGVSRSVVSAVLNGTPGIGYGEETRKAVLDAIKELNYEVNVQARGMKTGKSRCIAVLGDTGNPLFLQVLEGVQEACEQAGYHLILYGQQDRHRIDILNEHRQGRFDGLITLDDVEGSDESWLEAVESEQVPFVSIEGFADHPRLDSIVVDYDRSVRDALDYMAQRGAGEPDYVQFLLPDLIERSGETIRRRAYENWMQERGQEPVVVRLGLEDEEGLQAYLTSQVATSKSPALLVNWSVALNGLLRILDGLGCQPGRDCKLMALDNTLRVNQLLLPSIACMEIPYKKMGRLAGEKLLRKLVPSRTETLLPEQIACQVEAIRFDGESV